MKVLVTGGAGFIGSNFIKLLLSKGMHVINLDKLTYAGQGKNIEYMKLDKHPNYKFVKGDICNRVLVNNLFEVDKPEIIFNFAAESHVDRSIKNSNDFIMTNIIGTVNLLEASLIHPVKKFVQISTDEVTGSIEKGSFSEETTFNPSSPYSSSKACAELLALSYFKTHNLPIIITRSANNYGPYQFPEKLLPLFVTNLIDNKKVPLMWSEENPGLNVRDWLNVRDNCRAIWFVSQNGKEGEIYNIPGENERTNIEMTKMLLESFNLDESMIQHIEHRKAHDFRYSINGEKLKSLGFDYEYMDLKLGIKEVVDWYKNNQDWWRPLKK